MPLYDYKCRKHGVFQELAALADHALPAACPQCQEQAPRVILIPPQVLAMAPESRDAYARNERSRHEPAFSSPESRRAARIEHPAGCGCGQHENRKKSAMLYTADGAKIFPSQRPWMISH